MHTLLKRQLNRLNLNELSIPQDLETWEKIINFISSTYTEADQERYMLERSMELSSKEHIELNEKLEKAQHIARLGYWMYNKKSHKFSLSKELCAMLGLETIKLTFDEEYLGSFLHPQDQVYFQNWLESFSSTEKTEYEQEFRFKNPDAQEYTWYYVKAYTEPVFGSSDDSADEAGEKILNGIAIDITNRKQAEQEVQNLNRQLIESARLAGMADVAISVLHNVGNILNSANVSVSVLQEKVSRGHGEKLSKILTMMIDQKGDLTKYLTEDPKGRLIPDYLVALAPILNAEKEGFNEELSNLSTHIRHIKDIVSMQQTVSKVLGMTEKVFVPEILDMALQISGVESLKEEINLVKDYEKTPCFICVDKSKLLQILINLIQNAKDAVRMTSEEHVRKIRLYFEKKTEEKQIIIRVEDTGMGIEPENLTKIFSFGFTTKKNGHGFGLHGSALAAKELGGSLLAESEGKGKGATFALTLPLCEPPEH